MAAAVLSIDGPMISAVPTEWGPIKPGLPEESKAKLECALTGVTELARRELQAITLAHLLPRIE